MNKIGKVKKSFAHYVIMFVIILVLFGFFALIVWLMAPSMIEDFKVITYYFSK